MIVNVPYITIDGVRTPVYSIEFSNEGSSGPSSLSVSFVNKDGIYNWPDISTDSISKISIGSFFNFEGYCVSATKSNSPTGKILNVKYVDTSVLLDKSFVGLKGVHGAGFTTESIGSNYYYRTILLGEQVDPCKDLEESHEDPCAPQSDTGSSVGQENAEKVIKCQEQRLIKILDVVYTFNDLLGAIGALGIRLNNIPKEYGEYFGRHTGSLRDVLNSWCQEYGITFFWKDGIHFVDLKSGININDSIEGSECSILDSSETRTIEGNRASAAINYFGLDGFVNKYDSRLNGGLRLSLRPILIGDLFVDKETGELNSFIKKYYGDIINFTKCCILSKYSPASRDLFVLNNLYQFTDWNSLKFSEIKEVPNNNKYMSLIGIELVDHDNSVYSVRSEDDKKFISIHLSEYKDMLLKQSKVDGDADWFAAKCFYSEDVHQKFISLEKYIADEFMGRYWVRHFNKRGYSFSAPGGSAEFIPDPSSSVFQFSRDIPSAVLKLNKYLKELFDEGEQLDSRGRTSARLSDYNQGGIVLVERKSPFYPESLSPKFVEIEKRLQSEHFNFVDGFTPNVPLPEDGGSWDEKYLFRKRGERYPVIKLFKTYRKNSVKITLDWVASGPHPVEKDNVNIPITIGNFSSTYGLNSSICSAFRFKIENYNIRLSEDNQLSTLSDMFIYTPVQNDLDNYDFGFQKPGFTVVAEKNGSLSYSVLVNKLERVLADFSKDSSNYKNAIGMDVVFRDATQYLNKVLQKNETTCGYNEKEIERLLREFTSYFSAPSQIVKNIKSYTIGGVPNFEISVVDGLDSFSITLSADGGLITQLSYSNQPKIKKSESLLIKDFERRNIINYNKSFFSSDRKEIL